MHRLLLVSLVLLSLAAPLASAQMSSAWLGTKDLGMVMEGKPPAAPAPPPPPPPPAQTQPTTTTAVASSSAAPRDSSNAAAAVLPAAGPPTTLALIPVGDGSFAAVPVALATAPEAVGAVAPGAPPSRDVGVGFGFGAAALPVSPAAPAATAVPSAPSASAPASTASSAAPPRSLVGISRADDEAPDPINVEPSRPVGVASRAGRQAPSSGGGARGMPGGFAAPREAEPGVGIVGAVAPPPATMSTAPRSIPAPVFTGVEPVSSPAAASASAASGAASSASAAPAFSTSSAVAATSAAAASPVQPAAPIPTAPGLAETLSPASLTAMAANKPPRAAVQPPAGTLVGGMVVGDDGRPYLPAALEDAAAASGALRGSGITPSDSEATVAEGFAAPADAVAATTTPVRNPTVRPFAAPNTNASASASSPAPAPSPSSSEPASAAPAPAPSSSSSNSSKSGGVGFDCVAAALKLIAPATVGGKALCPTGDLRESQASLIQRARCSMLVDQVLARPTPSGQW